MTTEQRIDEFDPGRVAPGGKQAFLLGFTERVQGGTDVVPALVARGAQPGKTLVAMAGVHGDEYEGVRTIQDVFRGLDPQAMHGTFIGVPVANPAAHRAGTRLTPADQGNLARAFPGNAEGTATERLAAALAKHIIARADFLVDLHSAGLKYAFPPLVGYDASGTPPGKQSRAAAFVFGTPVLWGHPTIPPGRTISEASGRGIPWLYTEASGAGRIAADDLGYFVRGTVNVLKFLDILPGPPDAAPPSFHFFGEGDLDRLSSFQESGFFVPNLRLLDRVEVGQTIGHVRDLVGETIEEIVAREAGYLVFLRATPVVAAGDAVCVVAAAAPAVG
jgi:N2-acetyl-L-2,4-diaminobutanoate deacetylase